MAYLSPLKIGHATPQRTLRKTNFATVAALREKNMSLSRHILLLSLLVLSSGLFAQQKEDKAVKGEEKKSYSKVKNSERRNYLDEARSLREKSPTEAIKLIEEALLNARKGNDAQSQAEAYTLLGNIYEDINQPELALQRYEQALTAISRSKRGGNPAPIHQRMGQIYLDLKSDKEAELSFKRCIDMGLKGVVLPDTPAAL